MIYFPSCKINLGLSILSKRADGFHDLSSGMLEIPVHDVLEMVPAEDFEFTSSGLPIPGDGNLCIDAFRLLQQEFGLPEVKMHLLKNIPMGAGLGGGSSDAAFVLKLTSELFHLSLDQKQLENYASKLGSDCAFFVRGGFQLANGRGEVLSPMENKLSGSWIAVVNPGIHVSTKEAFSNVKPDDNGKGIKDILELPVSEWRQHLSNDFEQSLFPVYPKLQEVKDQLYDSGAIYASMSGSGSTLYGIFEEQPDVSQLGKDYSFVHVFQL